MKNKLLFAFIFSALIGWGQTDSVPKPTYKQRYGLRIGADISKPIRSIFDADYKGLELSADYRYNYNYFISGEVGFEKKNTETDYFNFSTQGQYLKLGADYNTYGNWYGMENLIFIGGRYAFSTFNQKVNSYTLHTLHNYWNEPIEGTNSNILTTYSGRTAHWLEFVVGLKVELFKNLYAGASIRLGKILFQNKNSFQNYYIPGFGRVWEDSSYGINYNYTLTYLIPFYKKEKLKVAENQKTKK